MNLNDVCIDSLLSNSATPLTADFHSPLKSISTVPSSFAAGRKPVNYVLGPKGSIVKKQLNPRKVDKKSDSFYEDILISRYFNGDQKQGREFIDLFRIRDKAGDRLANGMLCTLKQMGCKRTLMERVFGIGGYRYDHLDIERAQRTYQNSNAMTPSPEHSSSRNANINLIFPVSVEMDDGKSDPLEGHYQYSRKSSRSGSYSKYGE